MTRLHILILMTLASATAHAESPNAAKHREAFGNRAYIADILETRFRNTAKFAGYNYEKIPVMQREALVLEELSFLSCLLYQDTLNPSSEKNERQCEQMSLYWLSTFIDKYQDTLMYVQRFGQSPLALMPAKDVHIAMRAALRNNRNKDIYIDVVHLVVLPELIRQCTYTNCAKLFGVRNER